MKSAKIAPTLLELGFGLGLGLRFGLVALNPDLLVLVYTISLKTCVTIFFFRKKNFRPWISNESLDQHRLIISLDKSNPNWTHDENRIESLIRKASSFIPRSGQLIPDFHNFITDPIKKLVFSVSEFSEPNVHFTRPFKSENWDKSRSFLNLLQFF